MTPKFNKKPTKHDEYKFQVAICQYLEMQYPDVLFLSDTIASVKLTETQGARNKKVQKRDFSCPDLMILEPNKEYHGLFLELKNKSPYNKDGGLSKQKVERKNKAGITIEVYDHLEEQSRGLRMLRNKGFYADFCWDMDKAIKIIDDYMRNR